MKCRTEGQGTKETLKKRGREGQLKYIWGQSKKKWKFEMKIALY